MQRGNILGMVRQEHVAVVSSDDAQQVAAGATVAVLRPPPAQQAHRALLRDPGSLLKVLGADSLLVPLHNACVRLSEVDVALWLKLWRDQFQELTCMISSTSSDCMISVNCSLSTAAVS